jgi:hypothetical protein
LRTGYTSGYIFNAKILIRCSRRYFPTKRNIDGYDCATLHQAGAADGRRPYLDPVYTANHKVKEVWAVIEGENQRCEKFTYYLRYKKGAARVFEPVGSDAALALIKQQKMENYLAAVKHGNIVPGSAPAAAVADSPVPLMTPGGNRTFIECAIE